MDKREGTILLISALAVLFTSSAGRAELLLTASIAAIYLIAALLCIKKILIIRPLVLYISLLSPMLLIKYSTPWDFSIRIGAFTLLILLAAFRIDIDRVSLNFKNSTSIFLTAFLILSAGAAIFSVRGGYLTGDEPHYLTITQSIIEDGDFNIKDNYDQERYKVFIKEVITPHAKDIGDGSYSYHLPGLSFILVPFYYLFKLLSGFIPPHLFFRLTAAFINAFTASFLLLILYRLFPDHRKSLTGLWLILLSTFPLLTHSIHLFPELPAAGLFMAGFYLTVFRSRPLLAGLLFSIIPWIHIKYSPALAIFAVFLLYRYFREKRFKDITLFLLFPALSLSALLYYTWSIYSTLNPAGIYPKESYFSPPLLLRLKVFLSYFLDQRDGLVFYAPLFLLFIAGFRKRFSYKTVLISVLAFYVVMHASTTLRGAFAPQARPLMFTIWIMVLLLAGYWTSSSGRNIKDILVRLNYFIIPWLILFPVLNYQPVFSHTETRSSALLKSFSTTDMHLSELFPSFLTKPETTHTANLTWCLILLAVLLLIYLKPEWSISDRWKKVSSTLIMITILTAVAWFPHTIVKREDFQRIKLHPFYQTSGNFVKKGKESFRLLSGSNYDLFFDIKAQSQKDLIIELPEGLHSHLSFINGRREIEPFRKRGNCLHFDLKEMESFTSGKRTLIHLGISAEKMADRFLFMKIR